MRAIALLLLFALPANAEILAVACQGSNHVALVDPATMQLLKTIPTGIGPHEVAVSGDRRKAYVSLYGQQVPGNQLAVIDVFSRTETERVDLGNLRRPHGLAQSGGKIYFTSEMTSSVARYDPGSRSIDWIGKTNQSGSHMLAVSADGKRVFSGNIINDTVTIMEAGESSAVVVPVGDYPEGIAVSPDGLEVWSAARDGGGVHIIDTRTNAVVATILTDVRSARVVFSRDGTKVLLFQLNNQRNIVVVDPLTRQILKRIALPIATATPVSGIIAADSKTAYVVAYGPDQVLKVDLETYAFEGSVAVGIAPDGMGLLDDSPLGARRRSLR